MFFLPHRSSQYKNSSIAVKYIVSLLIVLFFVFYCLRLQSSSASEDNPQTVTKNDDIVQGIVNPFDSDCYDWRGKKIPCDFNRPYVELLLNKSNSATRFTDNEDGTVTDNMTRLVWLKNTNCFGIKDWQGAIMAAKNLTEGDCGPDPDLVLLDGSSVGDWRLPTMVELCTLIDFSKRDPALPNGHMFSDAPSGYHWSITTLDSHPELAWIVYIESGTTCYENVKNRAGYIWPVRKLVE